LLADLQQKRSQFLCLAWEKTRGNATVSVETEVLEKELGLTREERSSIIQTLSGKDLLKIGYARVLPI
jgi:hypothetical protein